ncbi:MAG TPA: GNAT family N-acetyltransferase [Chryseosolibacter sp.]|nr:GNAT family N-acetyltransferase [Chryseosolibacter sp.]
MDRFTLPEKIETERLRLLRLRYEDAEEIFYTYASKPEATKFLSWPTHRSIEDTHSFLRYANAGWKAGTDFSYGIRLKTSNQLIGSFGLLHEKGKIQIGYVLSPSQWGNGYATEACSTVMRLLRTRKELYRVSTFADVENVASIRVLKKSGLVPEATLVKWFRFVNQNDEPKDCMLLYLPLKH